MVVSMSWAYLFMFVPLLIACSGVLGATRYEKRELVVQEILGNAFRITLFMLVIYGVLQLVSLCV